MSLCTLVYASLSTRLVDDTDMSGLLESSRRKNRQLGITGLLLYRDGFYMQALEGEEAVVDELYNTIRRDQRHSDVILVYKETITERAFPEWSMGFNILHDFHLASLEGFSNFLKNPDPNFFAPHPNKAKQLLNYFRSHYPFTETRKTNLDDPEYILSSLLDNETDA